MRVSRASLVWLLFNSCRREYIGKLQASCKHPDMEGKDHNVKDNQSSSDLKIWNSNQKVPKVWEHIILFVEFVAIF